MYTLGNFKIADFKNSKKKRKKCQPGQEEMQPGTSSMLIDYSNSVTRKKTLNAHDVCAAVLALAFTRIQKQNKLYQCDEVKTQHEALTNQPAVEELGVLAASGLCWQTRLSLLVLIFYLLYTCAHTDDVTPTDGSTGQKAISTEKTNGKLNASGLRNEWLNRQNADWVLNLLERFTTWVGCLPMLSDQAMARMDQDCVCSNLIKIFHICMCPAHPPPGLRFHDLKGLLKEVEEIVQRATDPFVATQALLCPFFSQCLDALQFLYDEDQGNCEADFSSCRSEQCCIDTFGCYAIEPTVGIL